MTEHTVVPRLLLGTEGVKIYTHQMPREVDLPVIFHIDAFSGESAVQMWCLNPPNFEFYPEGASNPEICAGFIGHENRLALFCHTIGRKIARGFRRPYILPSCPDTRFFLSLEAVVCKFCFCENGQTKKSFSSADRAANQTVWGWLSCSSHYKEGHSAVPSWLYPDVYSYQNVHWFSVHQNIRRYDNIQKWLVKLLTENRDCVYMCQLEEQFYFLLFQSDAECLIKTFFGKVRRKPLFDSVVKQFPEILMVTFHVAVFHGLVHLVIAFMKVFLVLMRYTKSYARFYRLMNNHLNGIENGGIAGSAQQLFRLAAE